MKQVATRVNPNVLGACYDSRFVWKVRSGGSEGCRGSGGGGGAGGGGGLEAEGTQGSDHCLR